MTSISAITVVYNEENRIRDHLESFKWCDELIVVDKSSTDRTKEIALEYTSHVLTVPYSDTGAEIKTGIDHATSEWILNVVTSDIIHPELTKKILALIKQPNFKYDVIEVPYSIQAFGIASKHSPWFSPFKPSLIRKSVMAPKNEVHKEVSFNSTKIYRMKNSQKEVLYHLTHQDVDSFLERHFRYTKAEALKYNEKKIAMRYASWELIKAFARVIIKKRSFMLGWDGMAVALAYISYFIMKFLFIWEKFREKDGNRLYKDIQLEIRDAWTKENNEN